MHITNARKITTLRFGTGRLVSISPDTIVVDHRLDREAGGSPNTSPGPFLVGEQSWESPRTKTVATYSGGGTKHASPNARSQTAGAFASPLSDLSTLRSSMFQTQIHNQVRPGTTCESAWVLDDGSNDACNTNLMAIDDAEEVRNLKIEPVPDALHPAPTTINHQPEQPLQHPHLARILRLPILLGWPFHQSPPTTHH